MPDTWILVADRARARLFSLADALSEIVEIEDFVNPAARTPGRHRERGSPPRVHDRLGEGRHAIEAHTPPREKISLRFAAVLGALLEHAHAEQRYRELVLIAPPAFLGMLDTRLSPRLRATVVSKIPRNLTRAPMSVIHAELPPALFRHGAGATTR